jgi:hypothetical protein
MTRWLCKDRMPTGFVMTLIIFFGAEACSLPCSLYPSLLLPLIPSAKSGQAQTRPIPFQVL